MAVAGTKDPLNELLYLKGVAEKAKAGGNTAGVNYASNEAQQYYSQLGAGQSSEVKNLDAAGLDAYIKARNADPQMGQGPAGGQGVSTGQGGGVGVTDPNNAVPPVVPQGQSNTDMLLQQLMATLNGNSVDTKALQAQASADAAKKAAEQKAAFERLISSLSGQQGADLQGVTDNLAQGKADLEDTSFQNYLQSRQQIANRGLAGTGIANDADTRLLLANGKQLAGLNRNATTQMQQINAGYAGKLSDAQSQLAGVSQSDIERQMYAELLNNANTSATEKAKIYAGLVGDLAGYDYQDADSKAQLGFDYDKLGVDNKQFYDKLGSDEQQFYTKLSTDQQTEFAKMDVQDRQFYANLTQQDRQFYDKLKTDYDIDLTTIMGVDAQGRPTLDYQKLTEEVRRNKASEGFDYDQLSANVANWTAQNNIAAGNLQLNGQEFAHRVANDNNMLAQAGQGLQNESDKFILSGLQSQLSQVSSVIQSKISKLPDGQKFDGTNDPDVKRYNDIMNSINTLISPKGSASSGNNTGGSGGASGTYSNFYKSAKFNPSEPKVKAAENWISQGLSSQGYPQSWLKPLSELVARESSYDPNADNPSSSAHGLFQFLDSTRKNPAYGGPNVDWNDPQQQVLAGIKYVVARYGTPEKALAFWDKNKWY